MMNMNFSKENLTLWLMGIATAFMVFANILPAEMADTIHLATLSLMSTAMGILLKGKDE